ncbi:interferon-inducible double-stranded RNA-dependent protein kinase activator A-like [Sipha flava]|uniref:Interferon-inducible double-stranded RNA-dependent protein kinase activator A-like n=1 Tax=Sipha flava TaxID=143950 RepID=A0A8B8GH55_9HEMI|nr:interferon-inducible double-stranded RNA-dependent protein kinase activator A-like [Sipha flava]
MSIYRAYSPVQLITLILHSLYSCHAVVELLLRVLSIVSPVKISIRHCRPTMDVPPSNPDPLHNKVETMNAAEPMVNSRDRRMYPNPIIQGRNFQQQQQQPQSDESQVSCVVYDMSTEKGRRFKEYRRSKKRSLNVDEMAAKINSLKLNTEKSPVTKLNEFMNLCKIKIDFELVSVDGHVHSPVFTICAKCDTIVVFGQGASKKEAKKNAAIAFLNKLDYSQSHNIITSTTSNHSPASSNINHSEKVLESITNLNPIGVLQEFCIAHNWELPCYKLEESHRPKHSQYLMICTLKIYSTKGEGKTKQMAKRKAACHMYDLIKNLSSKEISAFNNYTFNDKMNNNELLNNNLKEQNVTNFCDTLQFLRVFFEELKSSKNISINILKELQYIDKSMMNVVEFLENIGQEEGFKVTYVLISTKSSDVEVLVQLVINPLVVNVGIGKTFEEAQEVAAFTTLMYLKLLLAD